MVKFNTLLIIIKYLLRKGHQPKAFQPTYFLNNFILVLLNSGNTIMGADIGYVTKPIQCHSNTPTPYPHDVHTPPHPINYRCTTAPFPNAFGYHET